MKITENEVEVAKRRSVIAPLLLFFFCLWQEGVHCFFFRHRCPRSLLSTKRYGAKTNWMLFLASKNNPPPPKKEKKNTKEQMSEKINK